MVVYSLLEVTFNNILQQILSLPYNCLHPTLFLGFEITWGEAGEKRHAGK